VYSFSAVKGWLQFSRTGQVSSQASHNWSGSTEAESRSEPWGAPISQGNAHISPDGTKVAAEIYDPQISDTDSDIWLYDTARGVKTRFTAKPGTARGPCWSPDGKHMFSAQIGEVISTSMKNPATDLETKSYV